MDEIQKEQEEMKKSSRKRNTFNKTRTTSTPATQSRKKLETKESLRAILEKRLIKTLNKLKNERIAKIRRHGYVRNYKPDPKGMDLMILDERFHELDQEIRERDFARSKSLLKQNTDSHENIYGLQTTVQKPEYTRSHSSNTDKILDCKKEGQDFLKYVHLLRQNGKHINLDPKMESHLKWMLDKRALQQKKDLSFGLNARGGNWKAGLFDLRNKKVDLPKKPRPRDIMYKNLQQQKKQKKEIDSESGEEIGYESLSEMNSQLNSGSKSLNADYSSQALGERIGSTFSLKRSKLYIPHEEEIYKSVRVSKDRNQESMTHSHLVSKNTTLEDASKNAIDHLHAKCSKFYTTSAESSANMNQDFNTSLKDDAPGELSINEIYELLDKSIDNQSMKFHVKFSPPKVPVKHVSRETSILRNNSSFSSVNIQKSLARKRKLSEFIRPSRRLFTTNGKYKIVSS